MGNGTDNGMSLENDIKALKEGGGNLDVPFLPTRKQDARELASISLEVAKVSHHGGLFGAPIGYLTSMFGLAIAGVAAGNIKVKELTGKDGPQPPVNKYGDNLSHALFAGLTSPSATDQAFGKYLTDHLSRGQGLQNAATNDQVDLLAAKTAARVTGLSKFIQDTDAARNGGAKPANPDATVGTYINDAKAHPPSAAELVSQASSVRREINKIDPVRPKENSAAVGTDPRAWMPSNNTISAIFQPVPLASDRNEYPINVDGKPGNNDTPFYNNKDHPFLDVHLTMNDVAKMQPNDYKNWQRAALDVTAHETRDLIQIVDSNVGDRRIARQEAVQKSLYSGVEDMLYKGIPADQRPQGQVTPDAKAVEAVLTRNDADAILKGKKPAPLEEQMKPFTEKMTEESKRAGRVAQWTTDPKQPIQLDAASSWTDVLPDAAAKLDQKFGTGQNLSHQASTSIRIYPGINPN